MTADAALTPLSPGQDGAITPRELVQRLRLGEGAAGRPRVVAAMIASVDGRAVVDGRSVALGNPADRELLRELRTAVDAILVGSATLAAERYATLLDQSQRDHRVAAGRPAHPLVATISRRLDLPAGVPILHEPDTPVLVYTEAAQRDMGTAVAVERLPPGRLTVSAVLDDLAAAHGVRAVLCEGGPGLLARLVAERRVDDVLLTVSPLLVGGPPATILEGPPLEGPPRMSLRAVHRAGDHLFLHYAAPG